MSIETGYSRPHSPVMRVEVRVELGNNNEVSEKKDADSAMEAQQNRTEEGTIEADASTVPENDISSQSDESLDREFYRNSRKNKRVPLEERRGAANRRAKQTQLYTQLVEDRLHFLEQEMDRILERRSTSPILMEPGSIGPMHARIVRLTWADFKAVPFSNNRDPFKEYKHVREFDLNPKNVLEILVEHPDTNEISSTHSYKHGLLLSGSSSDSVVGKDVSPDFNEPAMKIEHGTDVPVRLRVRSTTL